MAVDLLERLPAQAFRLCLIHKAGCRGWGAKGRDRTAEFLVYIRK